MSETEGAPRELSKYEQEIRDKYRPGDWDAFSFPHGYRSRIGELEDRALRAEARAAGYAEDARAARAAFDELLEAAGGDRNAIYEDFKNAWDAAHPEAAQPEPAVS